jgi:hypothetical protein
MNYAESFEEFATKLGPTDLALYAGAGIILWILFKDKLSPVSGLVKLLQEKVLGLFSKTTTSVVPVIVPEINPVVVNKEKEDVFFKLVVSWKQTRDLAVKSGCDEAVKVADQMFPYLSPQVCSSLVKEQIK